MTPNPRLEKLDELKALKLAALAFCESHPKIAADPLHPVTLDSICAERRLERVGWGAEYPAFFNEDPAVARAALTAAGADHELRTFGASEPVVRRQRQPNASEAEIQEAIAAFNAITLRKLGLDPSLATIRTSDELAALRSK